MDKIAALDAKTNFEALLDKAQREPVTVTQNARDIVVVISAAAFKEHQRLKLDFLRQEVRKGLDDTKQGNILLTEQAFVELDN